MFISGVCCQFLRTRRAATIHHKPKMRIVTPFTLQSLRQVITNIIFITISVPEHSGRTSIIHPKYPAAAVTMLVLFMSNSLQFSLALLCYFAHGKENNLLQCDIAYNVYEK